MNLATAWALAAVLAAADEGNPGSRAGVDPRGVSAAESGLALVQFSSPQCPHCLSMQPILAELAKQGVPVQVVDVTQQPNAARQFGVQGVPTFVALAAGRETGRIVGAASFEQLAQLVRRPASGSEAPIARGQEPEARSQDPGTRNQASADAQQAMRSARLASPDDARAATVRIKVEDAGGFGYGTGTVIDIHDREALVVTCGHLFRDSQGKGKITADYFAAGAAQTVEGQLIAYDLDRDIALISLSSGPGVRPAIVAPPGYAVRPGDRAFTLGCDKGADPSVRTTHITAVNKYRGKPNFTAAGQPVDGRSGGGLFSAEGFLIGICNAADPADDEGIYAGLASIHWQLDKIGQAEIYSRAARLASTARDATAAPVAGLAAAPPAGSTPQLPSQMPGAAALQTSASAISAPPAAVAPARSAAELIPLAAAGDDTEIVFIVRSKRDPAQRSEVYVVDQAAPDLIARITHAARTTGEQRAALARAAAGSAQRTVPGALPAAPPVVRGQSTDY